MNTKNDIINQIQGEAAHKAIDPVLATWPSEIWLQAGDEEPEAFPGMGSEVTWCDSAINRGDIKYVRADLAAPIAQPIDENEDFQRALASVIAAAHVRQSQEVIGEKIIKLFNSIEAWAGAAVAQEDKQVDNND